MPRESFAATVVRHTAIIEDTVLSLVNATAPETRSRLVMTIAASIAEINRCALLRIEKSDYEAERRDGQHLAELARVVRQRRG